MRRRTGVLLAVAVLLLAAGIAGAWYVGSASPRERGRVAVPGLEAAVQVWRDSLGVPHLWAASEHDLLFAQGYVHAQDRLWQMALFRRVAEGRLSELFGARTLSSDRFLRTIGLEREAGSLDGADRRRVEAYVAGVNAFLAGHTGAWPPEFVVLGVRPAPWRVQDVLAIEKVMAWDLSSYRTGVALERAVRRLGEEKARFLLPEYPAWGPTILEAPAPPAVPPVAAALLGAVSAVHASNGWVVAGSRTRSGKPILANDMHLELRAPSLWYLMALHGGGFDVAGMTLPGAPFVVAGHNRAVAWGFTNAMLDDVDLFIERPDPADSTRYLVPGGSEPYTVAAETLRVKGRDEGVVMRVRSTRHGPLLEDVEPGARGERLAFRWAAEDPARTWRAIPALDRATDWAGFLAAVRDFTDPHQNVVYADTAGHIGYVMAGRVPLRGVRAGGSWRDARRPPLLPVPGWTGEWDWTGWLPFEDHPRTLDPPDGYVVTANNRQAAGDVAALVTGEWEAPYRAARIRQMIREASRPLDAADVLGMQLDVKDLRAARYLDRAVAAAEDAALPADAAALRAWDAEAKADSRPAALFYVWADRLAHGIAGALYGPGGGWLPRAAVDRALEARTLPWPGSGGDAAFRRLAARAMVEADSIAQGRTWGELDRVVIEHPLGAVGALQRVFHFSLGPAPRGGSSTTVNISHYAAGRFPTRTTAGPSERHVVDMADPDGAGGFILPTGESGLPLDRHYRDQFEAWRTGGLWRIPLGRAAAERRAVDRLVLAPGG